MRQDWSIEHPQTLQNDFLALYCRYGMTPTCVSSVLMHVILPAKMAPRDPGKNLPPIDKKIIKNDGVKQYIVYFGGNGEDCIGREIFDENNNIVLWNYPGVGNSYLPSHSPEDLYRAGYSVVQELMIKEQVLPENITLYGYSLGGNVASEVARRLYREMYFVHLTVDRTFSTISAVIPEEIKFRFLNDQKQCDDVFESLLFIYASSLLGVSALMLSLGGLPSSIINTMTLTLMNALAMTGYCIAFAMQSVGIILQEMMSEMGFEKMGAYLAMPFIELGHHVNQIINLMAESLYKVIWWMVGIVSCVALIPILLAGIGIGLVCGTLLSIQLLGTKSPMVLPMHMMVEAALLVNSCSMNTVNAMNEIIAFDKEANIKIINTNNDFIIPPRASLCEAMGFFLEDKLEQQPLNPQVKCEWHRGDHNYLGKQIK